MNVFTTKATAHQIKSGYFILPLALYKEWSGKFNFNHFEVAAFGEIFLGRRLDRNHRIRVRLRDNIGPEDWIQVSVESSTQLLVEKKGNNSRS